MHDIIKIGIDPGKEESGVFAFGTDGEAYAWTFMMKGLTIRESLEIILKRVNYQSDWPVLVAYEFPYKS